MAAEPAQIEAQRVTEAARVRVLLADSSALHRFALGDALSAERDITVVGAVADGEAAIRSAGYLRPDVLLADVQLSGQDGVESCAGVKSSCPEVRVVLVSGSQDAELLLAAVESGVDGYVTKDAGFGVLVDALRRVHRGEAVVPPLLLGRLLRKLIVRNREGDRAMQQFLRLTPRERDVLALLVDGCNHAAVAEILVISPQTARTHIQNVIQKLQVHSRLEAAAFAVEHGFVSRGTVVPS